MIKLAMLHISTMKNRVALPSADYVLGRRSPSHLLILDPTVSSKHCKIWSDGTGWFIKDLSSTNGTWLNGIQLIPNQGYEIPKDSIIKIGIANISVSWDLGVHDSSPELTFPIILLAENEETSTFGKTIVRKIRKPVNGQPGLDPLHESRNPAIKELYQEAKELALSQMPIAIEGETGVGKELLARFIHQQSNLQGELITIVPTTSESLQESEFFGYKKGAFTGADRDYPGKIKLADRGTLFLDEISHIPHNLQVRLLRFLENGEIFPLGSQKSEHLDVRLLAASNVPFQSLVDAGTLRKDFYYRLCVHTLAIPPLRERKEDIVPLFLHFLNQENTQITEKTLSRDVIAKLTSYPWPGNIRELKTETSRVRFRMKDRTHLDICHLSSYMVDPPVQTEIFSLHLDSEQEKKVITDAITRCKGNKSQAAKLLNISRRGLYKKMDKLNLLEEDTDSMRNKTKP